MNENAEEQKSVSRAKILVIESEESTRNLLKRRLSIYGHEVMGVASSENAKDLLLKNSIDVIFLNMFINGKNSYDFLKSLKDNELYKSIPIIMISSDSDIELVVRCIEVGAEDYLVKPLNQTLLKARLANCISKKEAYDKEIAFLAKIEQGQKHIVAQEKMASIGVLVSSISQELKNPLNFVINFASVSAETCEEMVTKITQEKDTIPSELHKMIFNNLTTFQSNVKKIAEYGQKADNIIRFMLDQSTNSEDKKHPSNINKVIQQAVTMIVGAYKTNGITSLPSVETKFDNSVPHIPISVQPFSRAMYNILDNAFYSVLQKHEEIVNAKIVITTENTADLIKISIHDNGLGIKNEIIDKIYVPFFTTKTDGSGPGLGLSTAKEIIEEHNGALIVKSTENEYAECIMEIKK